MITFRVNSTCTLEIYSDRDDMRCFVATKDSGPQPKGGNRAVAPLNISKTFLVVRYSNKLHNSPPPENIS